ncbi:NADH dehydrogenase [ubiquinone] 1 alpha subcomplex subunit 12 [Vigna angularis]|uniref:NADH dehydrogenase [ubiquinone] 1 alpha subcomplex subunit 12 n=1 Tax=Phaseolus angularis TaxID=3914 RepID=A0A8T0JJH6_PHAAN|nr:NADH dehydrogenase [ubiquinone] 1 alpha subcomplex subunit 12 [Vigna angularis]
MASVVKNVLKSIREKGFGTFLRELKDEGYLRCLPDGNLLQTKIHNIGATVVGVDKFGNKYYEKLGDTQYDCFFWIWVKWMDDSRAMSLLLLKPKRYGVEHKENLSGEGEQYIYHSKGHALNPGQRDWTRYQPWESKA